MADSKTNKKKVLFLSSSVLLVAAISCCVFALMNRPKEGTTSNNVIPASETPATQTVTSQSSEEEIAAASNDAKDRMEANEKNAENQTVEKNSAGLKIAKPVVGTIFIEDNKVTISGAVPNINELEGTCIFTYTNGTKVLSTSSGILPGPQYITCEAIEVDKSKLDSGEWTVKIQYKSKTAEGESETKSFQI